MEGRRRSLHKVDSEGEKNSCSPCPARGSNPGSSELNSDSLTTELCPSVLLTVPAVTISDKEVNGHKVKNIIIFHGKPSWLVHGFRLAWEKNS